MIEMNWQIASIKQPRVMLIGICVGFLLVGAGISSSAVIFESPEHRQQLTQLSPDNPDSYFMLGESLGAQAESDQERFLAKQVFAIGIGLAHRQGNDAIAASMCIALAALESEPDRSAELWDLALMLDPARHAAWIDHRNFRLDELAQIREDAARCLYAARFNDSQTASALFERDEIRGMIRDVASRAGFDPARVDRLVSGLIHDASDDDCRGRVFIAQRGEGEIRRVVCSEHQRPISTAPNDEALRQLIKLELLLLNGSLSTVGDDADDAWETITYLNLDEPTIDPSASRIAGYYRVELTQPYWRDGRWVSSP